MTLRTVSMLIVLFGMASALPLRVDAAASCDNFSIVDTTVDAAKATKHKFASKNSSTKGYRLKKKRKVDELDAIVLHQTGAFNDTRNWTLKVKAHYVVRRDGTVYNNHPIEYKLLASHTLDKKHKAVAIELVGNYPNVKRRTWSWEKRDYLRAVQIDTARCLLRELTTLMPSVKYLTGHRQGDSSRGNDPGLDAWCTIGEWALRELGLENGPKSDYAVGSGKPIPESWRRCIAGDYRISGTSPKKKAYRGVARINPFWPNSNLWSFNDWRGVSVGLRGHIAVSWGKNNETGVGIYELSGDAWKGEWAETGSGVGQETILGKKLLGTHAIKGARPLPIKICKLNKGEDNDSDAQKEIYKKEKKKCDKKQVKDRKYKGQVTISERNGGLWLEWEIDGDPYSSGPGFRQGDLLFVGWDDVSGGVASYHVEDRNDSGRPTRLIADWRYSSSEAMGSEELRALEPGS